MDPAPMPPPPPPPRSTSSPPRSYPGQDGDYLVREILTSSIKEKLSKLPPNPTGYCIYKVPERLKADKFKEAFTPYVVSIGPFHHRDPSLKAMEDRKLRWLRDFFEECSINVFATVDFIVRNEATIRQHYEDLGHFSSDKFCEMILLDSIFILELLQGKGKEIDKELTESDIRHDMMLIENQLPLSVPRTIFIQSGGTKEKFNNLVYDYFFRQNNTTTTSSGAPTLRHGDSDHAAIQSSPPNQSGPARTSGAPTQPHEESEVTQLSPPPIQSEAVHFIEYLRMSYFDTQQHESSPSEGCNARNIEQLESGQDGNQQGQSKSLCSCCYWFFSSALCSCFFSLCSCFFTSDKSPRSAKELSEAGVKFSRSEGGRLNNIEFNGGELKIPRIEVNEWTETLFLNLIAFEQCKRLRTKHVCDYIVFMDSLVDIPEDVDILRSAGIIENSLDDSEKISNLFNNLYRENISERKSVHDGILKELKKYNKDPWHQWKAKWYKWKQMLKYDYFKSPWSAISLIAATILLILTAIQTAYSIVGTA